MPAGPRSGVRRLIQVAAVATTAAMQLPMSHEVLAPSRPWPLPSPGTRISAGTMIDTVSVTVMITVTTLRCSTRASVR